MVKSYLQKRKFRKACIAALCCVTVTCTGLAAACSPTSDDDDEATTYPKGEDTQLLKNGNFEYFSIPDDAVYLIKTPDSWSRSGDTSSAMSGIISTAPKAWEALTDSALADTLDYNNDLDADDDDYENYVDYNGMTSNDILYKDTYAALLDAEDVADSYIKNQGYAAYFGITEKDGKYTLADGTQVYASDNDDDIEYYLDEDRTTAVREQQIANPGTHYNVQGNESDGYYFMDGNDKVTVYVDETTGDYYYLTNDFLASGKAVSEAETDDKIGISNVLMIHNADKSTNNGISQHYGSSTTLTLQANTAAEISVWVKTSDLKFDKGYSQLDDEGRGAYIEVVQTVGGTTIDSFKIAAINTEKILANNSSVANSNGWLQYTIYVNACDFADSTVTINLGLGGDDNLEDVSGYAFFDDVTVTQYLDLSSDGCTYAAHSDEVATCSLTSEGDDKIFLADKEVRTGESLRYSETFYYLIDLASENVNASSHYEPVQLTSSNVTGGLTTETSGEKIYVSSTADDAKYTNVGKNGLDSAAKLPTGMNGDSRPTANDLIGIFSADKSFSASDFGGTDYSAKLAALTGVNELPRYKSATQSNMLVMLSAYGAAYTSTISDETFTLGEDEYVIISFWVKTSDLNGNTAATVKLYDTDDEDTAATLTVDTTDVTTDVGDNEDIYGGWVQCFFFVHNDTEETKSFAIDFSFGNTSLSDTTSTSYHYGWIALAHMQTLNVDETVYNLTPDGDYSAKLTLSETESSTDGTPFDEATGTSNVKGEIATPANYNGVNGNSSYVASNSYRENYDGQNTNEYAGLINRDYFEKYDQAVQAKILTSFSASAASWNDVFGAQCYQPLIIVNNLREYADNAKATDETYKNYYVLAEDDYEGDTVQVNGKNYRKVGTDEAFDEDTVYYSFSEVLNYGYIGSTVTLSASTYTAISVKVMVSEGAVAYIYLVDSDTREVLGYTTPQVTFWYDDEGNVLDEEYDSDWSDREHREHIVYTLRDDGLYEDKDGKVYANLYNLHKVYNFYEFEHDTFYDTNGNPVSFEDLVDDETYYSDENKTTIAEHFLCTADGTRVYEYHEGNYYYLISTTYTNDDGDEITTKLRGDDIVNAFDTKYSRGYEQITADDAAYQAVVGPTDGKWVTVNFLVHTGSLSKSYRLELWSGAREEAQTEGNEAGGAVAFDYSAYTVSSSNYDTLLAEYESNVVTQYKTILNNEGLLGEVASNSENIAYYEELVKTLTLSADAKAKIEELQATYRAMYYTYTLYDADTYVPFNADTANDGETGYDYSQSDYSETLAYFTYNVYDEDGGIASYNIFANYDTVEKDISIGTVADDDTDDEETESNSQEVWLLISSIILVVVLLITMLSILIRDIVKKLRRKRGVKAQNKNVYKKRDRYIKRLHLVRNEETPAEEETPVEEVPAEEPSEEETPAEETPAEEPSVEETPAENNTETTPAEDNKGDE